VDNKDNKDNNLFRVRALEQLSVANQLNQRIKIASKWSWLIVLALSLIVTGIIFWGVFGSIDTRVHGEGILLSAKGNLYNAVAPEGTGRIIRIVVQPGDFIEENEIVAHLAIPDLTKNLQVSEIYLTRMKNKYQALIAQSRIEIKNRKQLIQEQNEILHRIIKSENENLAQIKELLKIKQDALSKGLASKQDVMASQQSYYVTEKEINRAHDRLTENKIRSANFVHQWQQKLNNSELKISEQQFRVNNLEAKLTLAKEVRSPISGIVTHIQASIGDKVDGGEVVATLTSTAKELDVLAYIPAKDGKRVKPGMTVLISPTNIKKEEFGSIKGKVALVSPFPSTPKGMLARLQNEALVKYFSQKGAMIAVRIQLITDPTNPSGYEWTSVAGSEQTISAGTLVNSMITVKKQKPLSLIIPSFK